MAVPVLWWGASGRRSWVAPRFPDGDVTRDDVKPTLAAQPPPLLDLTLDTAEEGEAEEAKCRLCAILSPGASGWRFVTPEQRRAHAQTHASVATPEPLTLCFRAQGKTPDATLLNSTGESTSTASGGVQSAVGPPSPKRGRPSSLLAQSAWKSEPASSPPATLVAEDLGASDPPPPMRLLLWLSVLRKAWQKGAYYVPVCQYPGCAWKLSRERVPSVGTHIRSHVKTPSEECVECGFRKTTVLHQHFQSAHGGTRVRAIDIRSLNEDEHLKVLHRSFPGIRSARTVYAALSQNDETSPPSRFIERLERVSRVRPLRCHLEGCAKPTLPDDASSLDIEQHILGHHPEPVFSCEQCRFEGRDILWHGMEHVPKKASFNWRFVDGRVAAEEALLDLVKQCFPTPQGEEDLPKHNGEVVKMAPVLAATKPMSAWQRRVLSMEGTSKPVQFLWLMRQLQGYRAITKEGLNCAICNFVMPLGTRPDAHTYTHAGVNLTECSLCGMKARYKGTSGVNGHLESDAEHRRLGVAAMLDLRYRHDGRLADTALACFPLLALLRLWYLDNEQSVFARRIVALAALPAESLVCGMGDCGFALTKPKISSTGNFSEIAIHAHALVHYEGRPLFSCHSCRYEGSEIWEHIRDKHENFARRGSASAPFDDRRMEEDSRLVLLLDQCFAY